jgi:predicted transcriptional regulator
MFKNTTELAENKLLLLYIFEKLNMPLSNSHLTQVVLENNLIDYFSLQQYLSELVQSGFIKDTKEEKRHILTLTPGGKDVLEFFTSRIPENKRSVIDEYLNKHMTNIKKELEIVAEYVPHKANTFMTMLQLKDGEETLIELRLPAKTNTEARRLCGLWKENYQDFYERIKNMFYENK